jgi:predicted transcriptional regulator
MTTKAELHQLINELPDCDLDWVAVTIADALRVRSNPRLPRILREAPIDDEPLTTEDRAAIQEGRDAAARGDVVSDEDLDRELGW